MATAAASLFRPETPVQGQLPGFRDEAAMSRVLFERVLDQTCAVSEGIWLGTPYNLNLEYQRRELAPRVQTISHEHLVLNDEMDGWIDRSDLQAMAAAMPNYRLVSVPGVGHSMMLELPGFYAGYFGARIGAQADKLRRATAASPATLRHRRTLCCRTHVMRNAIRQDPSTPEPS